MLTVSLVLVAPTDGHGSAPVRATKADERQPAAAPGLLAWTEAPRAHRLRFGAYVRRDGGPRIRLNPRGTVGFTSGGAIDGTRVVFEQRRRFRSPGDLKVFDLATRRVGDPAPGVNTPEHEKGASLSGRWLLFTRISNTTDEVVLLDLITGRTRRLAAAEGRASADSGTVAGNYAAWIKCPRRTRCNAYVADITTGAVTRVPNPRRRSQYAVSVTAAGVVYFAESRSIDCGSGLALWHYRLGADRLKLVSLPRGRDVSTTSPLVNADGSTTLFYDSVRFRPRCRDLGSDIVKIEVGR